MPKKVEALSSGFVGGKRRRIGDVFVIGDNVKPGKWLKVLKDVPADIKAGGDDVKDALIAEAKSLGIENAAKTWGVPKLDAAIAEAKASQNE